MPKTLRITIKTYIKVLRLAANGKLYGLSRLPKEYSRAVNELIKEGLLSEKPLEPSLSSERFNFIITPKGCVVLETLSKALFETTIFYKFGDVLLRILWVLIGAIAATIPKFIEKII